MQVLDFVLSHATYEAKLSLAPVLAVLAAMARDLQADFLPFVPRVFATLAALVSAAATDADALQSSFLCVATILKHLQRPLADRVPWLLLHSRALRYQDARHSRCFAAQVRECDASIMRIQRYYSQC